MHYLIYSLKIAMISSKLDVRYYFYQINNHFQWLEIKQVLMNGSKMIERR